MKRKSQRTETDLVADLAFQMGRRRMSTEKAGAIIHVTGATIREWIKGKGMNEGSAILLKIGLEKIKRLPLPPVSTIVEDRRIYRMIRGGLTQGDKTFLFDAKTAAEYHSRLLEFAVRHGVEAKREDDAPKN